MSSRLMMSISCSQSLSKCKNPFNFQNALSKRQTTDIYIYEIKKIKYEHRKMRAKNKKLLASFPTTA